jgi:hypothetical protein
MSRAAIRILAALFASALPSTAALGAEPLHLIQRIALPGVEGRIDHLSVDGGGQRLFVAALGNGSVEVIDLKAGARTRSIPGFTEPQGVAFVADANELFVADGGTGVVSMLDGTSLAAIGTVAFGKDADNLRYDAGHHRVYVGYGDGALASIDTASGTRNADRVKLAGHPESFQLETSGSRIFVNVPDASHIAVVDRTSQRVIATWPSPTMRANFPMALDEPDRRLFVGFRKPAKLAVYDTSSGNLIASLDCSGDLDDVFYDADRKRLYLTAGAGAVDVVSQRDADHYEKVASVATAAGARTSLWVAPLRRLYVAVPHRGEQRAEIRVYEAP